MSWKIKNQISKIKMTYQNLKFFKNFTFYIVILIFTLCILHFPTSVHAQTTPVPANISPTSPIFTDLIMHNMFHTFSCLAVGSSTIGQPCLTYVSGVPVLSQANLSGGALGATSSLIGMLYSNPPVRTVDYLASVGQGLGIVKTAHAQVGGSGNEVLKPVLSLWQVSRNISYLIMIIIFVIIGMMVMFRQRINPQTVITAQAALPGLVIGLILITFSYFLAALISDMAFIGTNMVGYYFSAAQGKADNPQDLVSIISNKNIFDVFTPFSRLVSREEVGSALSSIWDELQDPTMSTTDRWNPFEMDPQKAVIMLTGFIFYQMLSPFANLAGGWSQIAVGLTSTVAAAAQPVQIASVVLSFIAILVLIYSMMKLLLRLINAFLTIIFLTVTGPFQFLAAALPGRQTIATGWILNMVANILIFPAVLAVLYFVAFLLGPDHRINKDCAQPCTFIISDSSQTENNFISPVQAQGSVQQTGRIVGQSGFPLFGGLSFGFIQLLLAFGALVALPSIPDIVVRTVGRIGQAGQLIGQEISGDINQGRVYAGQFQSGVGGIGGQVGRITSEHGLVYKGGKWVAPETEIEKALYTKAGQGVKISTGLTRLFGRGGGGVKTPPKIDVG